MSIIVGIIAALCLCGVVVIGGSPIDFQADFISSEMLPLEVVLMQHLKDRVYAEIQGWRWAWCASAALVCLAAVAWKAKCRNDGGTWWYKDLKGAVQGPFSTFEMRQWHELGYLSENLPIKWLPSAPFVPLGSVYPVHASAFQGPPADKSSPSKCADDTAHVAIPESSTAKWARGETGPLSDDDEEEQIKSWRSRRQAMRPRIQAQQMREFCM